jgi:hypothetical protein
MTSIKTFENRKRQKLEKDVNKFLEGYENCITSVNLSTFTQNQLPIYLALVTIQEKIPRVTVETGNNRKTATDDNDHRNSGI